MAQPSTIYKPGKLNYVWNYIGTTLKEFKAKLLGYRTYTAIISQSGTSDPVAIVLENNLGQDIVWTRLNTGFYKGSSTGLFTNSKTTINSSQTDDNNLGITATYYTNLNDVYIVTYDYTGAPLDGVLAKSFVEIRVYL